jgi:hypothetical protein
VNADRDLPQPGNVGLACVERPKELGIFVKRDVVLPAERHHACGDLRELGLAQLGGAGLLLDFQGPIRAATDQPADHGKGHQKDAQRDHDFQERESAPAASLTRQ